MWHVSGGQQVKCLICQHDSPKCKEGRLAYAQSKKTARASADGPGLMVCTQPD